MAKGRMINRTIATSRKIDACSRTDQWYYFRLMPFVDDEGKLPGDLFALKNLCFPAEALSEVESRKFLNKLHTIGLVKFAEDYVIELVGFIENQKIGHRPAKSLYPDYQEVTGKGEERFTRSTNTKPALTSINLDSKEVYKNIQGLILYKQEFEKLLKSYSRTDVDDVLLSMGNYKGLSSKYVSAYKTALNWLKRRASQSNAPAERPMRSTPE